MTKTLLATQDTFTKANRFVPKGSPVDADEVDYEEGKSPNLIEAPAGLEDAGAIQMSAISPTGPNPTAPQQLAPGTTQGVAGYTDNGMRVVGEVTKPAKERFVQIVEDDDTTQGEIADAIAKGATAANAADVSGTVADITNGLSDRSDAELTALLDAENARDKPRTGVTSAIEAEQANRASALTE